MVYHQLELISQSFESPNSGAEFVLKIQNLMIYPNAIKIMMAERSKMEQMGIKARKIIESYTWKDGKKYL